MKIKELFKDINYEISNGNDNLEINDIKNNTNTDFDKTKNTLFICIVGLKFDGHDFIKDAIAMGAKAILVSKDINIDSKNVTIIKVDNTREVLNKISFKFFNNPQNDMNIVGVTGTSGKTSTTIILEDILKGIGIKSAVLGTLGNRIGTELLPINTTTITTADSLELAKMFDYIKNSGIKYTIMEATSHALSLNRVDAINFEVGVFTNLGIEHLDFHKTLEAYAEAKFKLFSLSKKAVLNIDDKYGKMFFEKITNKEKLSVSLQDDKADLYANNIKITPNGTFFDLQYNKKKYESLFVNLVGIFSVYNTICAVGAALLLNNNIEDILKSLNNIDYIKGRCESIKNNKGINIIIDYAHTAEQFENILKAMKLFTKNKIISLFGCGGDRDNSKRFLMGKTAAKMSDYVIVAEDNPRSENPENINSQIEAGIKKTDTPYKMFVDREKAIKFGLSIAKEGDTFIMMGKGPERYQEYENKRKEYFCEREVVENYFNN